MSACDGCIGAMSLKHKRMVTCRPEEVPGCKGRCFEGKRQRPL